MQCLNPTGKSLSVIFALTSLPAAARDAAGMDGEAAPYWAKAMAMAEKSNDQQTISKARARLQKLP